MLLDRYIVLEGIHEDPNNVETLDKTTQKTTVHLINQKLMN